MAQFVLKIEKLSHIMGPRASQDLRSPSPIMAPGKTCAKPARNLIVSMWEHKIETWELCVTCLVRGTDNMIFFSSQKQFFQKNWQSLSMLSISQLKVKQAVLLSMQTFLRTWQEHWLVNNLAQLPTQSKLLFSCTFVHQNHTVFSLYPSSKAQLTWR